MSLGTANLSASPLMSLAYMEVCHWNRLSQGQTDLPESHGLLQDLWLSVTRASPHLSATWVSLWLSAVQVSLCRTAICPPVPAADFKISPCQLATGQREMAAPMCLPSDLLTILSDRILGDHLVASPSSLLSPIQKNVPKTKGISLLK